MPFGHIGLMHPYFQLIEREFNILGTMDRLSRGFVVFKVFFFWCILVNCIRQLIVLAKSSYRGRFPLLP